MDSSSWSWIRLAGVTIAAVTALWSSLAHAQQKMSYVGPESSIEVGDVVGNGQSQSYVMVSTAQGPSEKVACSTHIVTFPDAIDYGCYYDFDEGFICGSGDILGLPFPTYTVIRTCVISHPFAVSTLRTDSSNVLATTLLYGDYHLDDVSALSNAGDAAVVFGFSTSPRYVRPDENFQSCPTGTVLVSSPRLSSLSATSKLCVETVQPTNGATLASQIGGYFNDLENPSDADADIRAAYSVLATATGNILFAYACLTDSDHSLIFCLTSAGKLDLGFRATFELNNACPTPVDNEKMGQCVSRGNQTSIGCAIIACVEALDGLGNSGCRGAIAAQQGAWGIIRRSAAGAAICALIAKRNHYYTASRWGQPVRLCSSAVNPHCTPSFVFNELLKDVRGQAPGVLQGRPVNGIPADPLTTVRPIDTANSGALVYLGPDLFQTLFGLTARIGISTFTSNPIQIVVSSAPETVVFGPDASHLNRSVSCRTATNVTDQDHLLQGDVKNCIFQDGDYVSSIAVGTGFNTRFALLNELLGPKLIGITQTHLFNTIGTDLPPPPGPPCKRLCNPTD